MTAPPLPPLFPQACDIASTDDSLERMVDDFRRPGDTYRVFASGRKSGTRVIHDPEGIKRVLVDNHRNCTKGPGLDRVETLLGNDIMMTVHVSSVARRFRLRHPDEGPIQWEALVNLRTRNNLRFRLEPR